MDHNYASTTNKTRAACLAGGAGVDQPTAEPFSDPPLLRGAAVAAEKQRTVPVKDAVQLETGNELADKAPIPRCPPRPHPRMKRRAR